MLKDPSIEISVIVDKPCWVDPISQWEAMIQPAVIRALEHAQWYQSTEISILLTDDTEIQHLNKTHRQFDKPTNVLSFPSLEASDISQLLGGELATQPIILGDIALSFQTIQKEALAQNKLFEHHLIHLVIHGVLHLLSFDHENDKDALRMESLETQILFSLNISDPYSKH